MRESEVDGYNGVIWYLLGAWTVLRFMPKDVGVVSVLLLSWCDTAASTVGRVWGRYTPRVRRGKSLAGSLAAFTVGVATAWLFWAVVAPYVEGSDGFGGRDFAFNGKLSLPRQAREILDLSRHEASISGMTAMGVLSLGTGFIVSVSEAVDIFHLDDNLTIPVLCGIGFTLFFWVFGGS